MRGRPEPTDCCMDIKGVLRSDSSCMYSSCGKPQHIVRHASDTDGTEHGGIVLYCRS